MKQVQITQQEIRMATRPNVYRNRKKWNRKSKENAKSNIQIGND
jgi:hypothetical protein